jgi:hypothetical protein
MTGEDFRRAVHTVIDTLGTKALSEWLRKQSDRCPEVRCGQEPGAHTRCVWHKSTSFALPYGSAKIILHGIEKRYHADDEIEDDEPTVREPAGQDQDLRSRPLLDWSTHWSGRRQAPCTHCHQPALLFDDARRPAHKVCAELALAALLGQSDETMRTRTRA